MAKVDTELLKRKHEQDALFRSTLIKACGVDIGVTGSSAVREFLKDLSQRDLEVIGLAGKSPIPSNPQTTDLAIHCNGIDEVSHSRTAGFKQMVTLADACVEDMIENICADRFFAAFDNEELAEHLRKYGYEVTKND